MLPVVGSICPFCQEDLEALDLLRYDKYIHHYCPKKCCKVMTYKSSGDWVLFRIHFDINCSLEIDKRLGEKFLYRDYNVEITDTYLPIFDIRTYSLLELKNKIKKYLLFL